MVNPRPVTDHEARRIGIAIGDPLLAAGHPLTCNGGNPDFATHHDHEVRLLWGVRALFCPKCGREQPVPPGLLKEG